MAVITYHKTAAHSRTPADYARREALVAIFLAEPYYRYFEDAVVEDIPGVWVDAWCWFRYQGRGYQELSLLAEALVEESNDAFCALLDDLYRIFTTLHVESEESVADERDRQEAEAIYRSVGPRYDQLNWMIACGHIKPEHEAEYVLRRDLLRPMAESARLARLK